MDIATMAAPVVRQGLSTPRTRALHEKSWKAGLEVSTLRAEIFTREFARHDGQPLVLRRALANQAVMEEIPVRIYPGELIAGSMTEKRRGAVIFPEIKAGGIRVDGPWRRVAKHAASAAVLVATRAAAPFSPWLRAMRPAVALLLDRALDGFETRSSQAFHIAAQDRARLRRQVLPYWRTRTSYRRYWSSLTRREKALQRKLAYTADNQFAVNLYNPDIAGVMSRGLLDVAREARERAEAAGAGAPQRAFHEAIAVSAAALITLARRYAGEAERLAAVETQDAQRRAELLDMARTLRAVPEQPPQTFREAIQAYWFLYLGMVLHDGGSEVPFGRFDVILRPYYERDLAAGRLTREAARELVEAFFVKANELVFFLENGANLWEDGNTGRLTLTIGGINADGRDVTSDLSFMVLDALESAPFLQPNVAARLHEESPEAFTDRVMEVLTSGANALHVFNDAVIVDGFLHHGFSLADARDYIIAGCVQPAPRGAYGSVCAAFVNLPRTLELFVHGAAADGHADFASFEDAYAAFAEDVLDVTMGALAKVDAAQSELIPDSFVSIFHEGTLASGRDVKSGGARGNLTGISLVGLATLADSLTAIRSAVFEEQRYSLPELRGLLRANFVSREADRLYLLNKIPKFGNGDPRADEVAADLVGRFHDALMSRKTFRGGLHGLGFHSESGHVVYGAAVGATPDGRKATEPLSVGVGPASGRERKGYTATLKSIASLDATRTIGGTSANLRFHPRLFASKGDAGWFKSLVKAHFFRLRGQHLQVNVVSSEVLRDAQRQPHLYGDLLVRISGYSARFVELTPSTQNEIISRAEHGMP
ncbi:MAG: hypothetical protein HYV63_07800 [Candidatus Schekmanbacteria bacterium]|nr:hypothetical protein [Candidatus Schekmanbacteria bacterium]